MTGQEFAGKSVLVTGSAGIARAVISREQQAQFFVALPALAASQHPLHARHANQRANPRH